MDKRRYNVQIEEKVMVVVHNFSASSSAASFGSEMPMFQEFCREPNYNVFGNSNKLRI
jgi:hypothetical protein